MSQPIRATRMVASIPLKLREASLVSAAYQDDSSARSGEGRGQESFRRAGDKRSCLFKLPGRELEQARGYRCMPYDAICLFGVPLHLPFDLVGGYPVGL